MTTVPPAQPQTGGSQQKPTAAGIKIRQRKRAVVYKYEPEAFRDQFLDLIPEDPETSLDKFSDELEANEAKLDIKRYAEQFNEMFLVGGLVAPGGVIQYGDRPNPYSVFASTDTTQIKARVDILTKLARRLKYLPRMLEETLSHLLQYINKFGENSEKLATGVGILIANGTLPLPVLASTLKDHLVQDGSSLRFMTDVLKAYLREHSQEHLSTAIIKSGMDAKMPEFFPSDKRDTESVSTHLTDAGLKGVAEVLLKQRRQAAKNQMRDRLREMFGGKPVKSSTGAGAGGDDDDDDRPGSGGRDGKAGDDEYEDDDEAAQAAAAASAAEAEAAAVVAADAAEAAAAAAASAANAAAIASGGTIHAPIAATVAQSSAPSKAQQHQVVAYIRDKIAVNKWTDQEAIPVIWEALMASTDFGTRADQAESTVIKTVTAWSPVLAVFCTTPKTELALLIKVQQFCYESSVLIKHFRVIVQHLYKHDVVSESAVLYWFERGAAPQGKTVFVKQMEPFVKWLRETEADDDDDDDEEDN